MDTIKVIDLKIFTKPYKEDENDESFLLFDGVKVIGEVIYGGKIIFTKEIIVENNDEFVFLAKKNIREKIKIWVDENINFHR